MTMPATIRQVSDALHAVADNTYALPPFPAHAPSQMAHPSYVETLGTLHMRLAASLAQEIMIKAARETAYHCGLKPDDMIETIQADCEHMLEACEREFRSRADVMREEG